MSASLEVKVPDIGDSQDVEVIEILVKAGDRIEKEQSLITVESDKASMEIPASAAGVVEALKVKVGDRVNTGSLILTLSAEQEQAATSKKPTDDAPSQPESAPTNKASAETTSLVTVVVPDIGDFEQVEVIEVLVAAGDEIKQEQSLVTVESDKASMEIPASHSGVVQELKVKVGDRISKGNALVTLQAANGNSSNAKVKTTQAQPQVAAKPGPTDNNPDAEQENSTSGASSTKNGSQPHTSAATSASTAAADAVQTEAHAKQDFPSNLQHASPSVRKLARELGVDLAKVRGTAPKSRISLDDVRAYVKGAVAAMVNPISAAAASGAMPGLIPWPQVDFAKFGPVVVQPLQRIKKLSGANLHRNWVMIPHVTNHDQADITDLETFRVALNQEQEAKGIKLTLLAFLVKACAQALKKFPEFNSSLDGEQLVLKHHYHVGFAADTPNGLVVPVIRDADKKGLLDIAQDAAALARKAREGKLTPADMQGGTFSISSLGGIGGTYFTPIINAPEVAILGVCKAAMQPVWQDSAFQPRLMLPLSLSWDHRVIDGASAARFNNYLAGLLSDYRRMLL